VRKKLDENREKARKKADQWEKKVKAKMGHLKKQADLGGLEKSLAAARNRCARGRAASPGFALPSMNP
jgi:hypothetical protein